MPSLLDELKTELANDPEFSRSVEVHPHPGSADAVLVSDQRSRILVTRVGPDEYELEDDAWSLNMKRVMLLRDRMTLGSVAASLKVFFAYPRQRT